MPKFIAPYYVTQTMWGISSRDLASVIDEPIEKVNWIVMKAHYGGNFLDHEIVQLTRSKNSSDAIYALAPFAAMGVCFMIDNSITDFYGYYLLLDRYRCEFFNNFVENRLPDQFTTEQIRDHLKFLKKSVIKCKKLKVKNEIIREICALYANALNILKAKEKNIDRLHIGGI